MQTPEELNVKTRPFFLNYFNKLAQDLNTLTAAPVTCSLGAMELLKGRSDLDTLFEADRSVAYVREDGKNTGTIHLIFNLDTSISLTGMMMMMGEGLIKEQVKSKKFTEELQEGFQEVANQVVGAMNDLVERKFKGGHLHLDATKHYRYGDFPTTLQLNELYFSVSVEIQVGNFPPQPARWLISQKTIEAMFEIKVSMEAAAAAAAAAAAGGGVPGEEEAAEGGIDLSQYANVGVDTAALEGGKPDLSQYANVGTDPNLAKKKGIADLSAFAAGLGGDDAPTQLSPFASPADLSAFGKLDEGDEAPAEDGRITYSRKDNLPLPDAKGSIVTIMREIPCEFDEEVQVIRAINAMRQDGYKYIGITRDSKLVRVITESDLRQIMGPFFGTKAMTSRDKAICTVPLGKINKEQQLIRISTEGSIRQAADLLMEFELRALPVVSPKGVLRGFVTVHAVLNYFRKKRQVSQ